MGLKLAGLHALVLVSLAADPLGALLALACLAQ